MTKGGGYYFDGVTNKMMFYNEDKERWEEYLNTPRIELIRNKSGNNLVFIIEGNPATKQSVRIVPRVDKQGNAQYEFTAEGKKKVKMAKFQTQEQMNKEVYAKWCIKGQLPFGFQLWEGPIAVIRLHYIFYPPKKLHDKIGCGEFIWMESRPDMTDNLNKLIFDSMKGIVYVDDKQIVYMNDLRKYYGLQPKTIIELRKI